MHHAAARFQLPSVLRLALSQDISFLFVAHWISLDVLQHQDEATSLVQHHL